MNKIKDKLEKWLPKISLILVILYPVIKWLYESISNMKIIYSNPYTIDNINIALIFGILNLIYRKLLEGKKDGGDESKILQNRNQSDYYEIWEACQKQRNISIDAFGHTFKTLWFNFIQKFLNEVIKNYNHYDTIKITLVSTNSSKNCFPDIIDFFDSLDPNVAKKITINLLSADQISFFTGICVNEDTLWLSIREPHSREKANEHVREWKRKDSETSKKMIDWFLGIIKYYITSTTIKTLKYNK